MLTLALGRRQSVVDGGANDRVDEGERELGTKDACAPERRCSVRSRLVIEGSERSGVLELDVVAEDGDGARE